MIGIGGGVEEWVKESPLGVCYFRLGQIMFLGSRHSEILDYYKKNLRLDEKIFLELVILAGHDGGTIFFLGEENGFYLSSSIFDDELARKVTHELFASYGVHVS